MVTRGITQPGTDTLPLAVTECAFPLLPLVRYPLWLTTVIRYHPTDSNGNIIVYHYICECICCQIGVSLVTILLLDFVWIHWIQWKLFRENSIVLTHDDYFSGVTSVGALVLATEKTPFMQLNSQARDQGKKCKCELSDRWDSNQDTECCHLLFLF